MLLESKMQKRNNSYKVYHNETEGIHELPQNTCKGCENSLQHHGGNEITRNQIINARPKIHLNVTIRESIVDLTGINCFAFPPRSESKDSSRPKDDG